MKACSPRTCGGETLFFFERYFQEENLEVIDTYSAIITYKS
jgi:hypothetical protein